MRKLFNLLVSRMFWTVVALLLEIFIVVTLAVNHFSGTFYNYTIYFRIFTLLVGLYVAVVREVNPSYKLAWLLLFLLLPRIGGILYLILGEKNIGKHKQKKLDKTHEKYVKAIGELSQKNKEMIEKSGGVSIDSFCNYVREFGEGDYWIDSAVKYFNLGDYAFESMIKDIKKAEKFVFLEFFIIDKGEALDRVLAILKEKVKAGVEVRILYDDIGSMNTLSLDFCRELEESGIKAARFNEVGLRLINPRLNYRDHRKIVSIDGNVAYTGGFNLADEYINRKIRFGHWKDSAVRIEGPAVWNLTHMFLETWGFTTNEVSAPDYYLPTVKKETDGVIQPFGTNPLRKSAVGRANFVHLISNAKKYIWMSTPYLIIDDEITSLLTLAAESGVDVRIVTPHIPDKKTVFMLTRSNYEVLIRSGVKIYEYAPGFIHAKMLVCDDFRAYVGTVNMDYRSFFLHFECGVLLYGCSVIKDIKADFEKIFSVSMEIDKDHKVCLLKRIFVPILKAFSPMM